MGHSSEIFDIIGFSCTSPTSNDLRWLDLALNEPEYAEEYREEMPEYICNVYEELKGLGVESVMADRMMAAEPMAIGWWKRYCDDPTSKQLNKLEEILKRAGLKPKRLDKDRFISYG